MDRESCLRGFKEVFDIDCEEVALRFFRLFTMSDKEVIFKTTDHVPHSEDAIKFQKNEPFGNKTYRIDILRFFEVITNLLDTSESERRMHHRLIFLFYDYDNTGSIGSVDIINLEKHFSYEYIEKVVKTFTFARIQRDIKRHLAFYFMKKTKEEVNKKLALLRAKVNAIADFEPQDEDLVVANTKGSQLNSHYASDEESSDEEIVDEKLRWSEDQKIEKNWWTRSLAEIYTMRTHFVANRIKPQDKNVNQNFLDFKHWEGKFLSKIEQHFEFKAPAILYFFKEKLQYQFKFSKGFKRERGSMYKGWRQKHKPAGHEVDITRELIQMQKSLDSVSKRFTNSDF